MLRVYLSGPLTVEGSESMLGPGEFPGRQGRAAFAYLVAHRGNPVTREAVAEALWARSRPEAWETAISAIVSKLRSRLTGVGVDGTAVIPSAGGCYEVRLPPGSWVDHEAALDGIHEAEAALLAGDHARAYGPSAVAHHIARRPFLPGQEGAWFEARRDRLGSILVRALECRARVYLWNGEHPLGIEAASEMVRLSPFRETGYRLLMRSHAAAGNTAEALQVYERCRTLLADELGVPPSPETRSLHGELLRSL